MQFEKGHQNHLGGYECICKIHRVIVIIIIISRPSSDNNIINNSAWSAMRYTDNGSSVLFRLTIARVSSSTISHYHAITNRHRHRSRRNPATSSIINISMQLTPRKHRSTSAKSLFLLDFRRSASVPRACSVYIGWSDVTLIYGHDTLSILFGVMSYSTKLIAN